MEKKQIKVSDVLGLLEQGKDRAAIKQELNLTHSEMAALFKHPKLKNKKPKAQNSFVLVDDTTEQVEDATANPETQSEAPSEAQPQEAQGEAVATGTGVWTN